MIPPPNERVYHASLFDDLDHAPQWVFLVWGNLFALIPLFVLILILWLPYQFYLALGTPLALFPNPEWSGIVSLIVGAIIIVASMFIHELLHALALRLLGYHPLLSYQRGFLFAAIRPGEYIARSHYLIMVLTPLISMTLIGAIGMIFLPAALGQIILIALLLNGAASVGDLWVARRVIKQPRSTWFASDDEGIKVYLDERT